jgi:hypothetical protein
MAMLRAASTRLDTRRLALTRVVFFAVFAVVVAEVLSDVLPLGAALAGRALIVDAVRPSPARASAEARTMRGVAGMVRPFPRL